MSEKENGHHINNQTPSTRKGYKTLHPSLMDGMLFEAPAQFIRVCGGAGSLDQCTYCVRPLQHAPLVVLFDVRCWCSSSTRATHRPVGRMSLVLLLNARYSWSSSRHVPGLPHQQVPPLPTTSGTTYIERIYIEDFAGGVSDIVRSFAEALVLRWLSAPRSKVR